jgi:hypothetical protein
MLSHQSFARPPQALQTEEGMLTKLSAFAISPYPLFETENEIAGCT